MYVATTKQNTAAPRQKAYLEEVDFVAITTTGPGVAH